MKETEKVPSEASGTTARQSGLWHIHVFPPAKVQNSRQTIPLRKVKITFATHGFIFSLSFSLSFADNLYFLTICISRRRR
ncbi:hypothetical protein, partial [uncultured Bacteroides sp.]